MNPPVAMITARPRNSEDGRVPRQDADHAAVLPEQVLGGGAEAPAVGQAARLERLPEPEHQAPAAVARLVPARHTVELLLLESDELYLVTHQPVVQLGGAVREVEARPLLVDFVLAGRVQVP
jgi:hypothetical protein